MLDSFVGCLDLCSAVDRPGRMQLDNDELVFIESL